VLVTKKRNYKWARLTPPTAATLALRPSLIPLRPATDAPSLITWPVLPHILPAIKLGGPWVEIHADPSSEMESLPLLFRHGFALAHVADNTRLASLRHLWRRFSEDWEQRSQRRRQEFEDA